MSAINVLRLRWAAFAFVIVGFVVAGAGVYFNIPRIQGAALACFCAVVACGFLQSIRSSA